MIRLAHRIAFLTVRYPFLLILAAGCIALAAGTAIYFKLGLDSEILNLLPKEKASVQGLQIYNQKFSEGRTLAFIVTEKTGETNGYEEFVSQLLQQPWVLRILDGSPLESQTGRNTLAAFATPLLFRLNHEDFSQMVQQLKPAVIRQQMERLVAQLRGDSPLARFQLQTDPLGVLALAIRPLTAANTFQDQDKNVSGSSRLVPVIIRQPTLSAEDSSRVMHSVDAFITNFTQRHPEMEILVTGRSAYVDQVSQNMKRDFMVSSFLSMMLISGLFLLGFRRLLPLLGSTLLLILAAVVALAVGSLLFGQLNLIAIAFCSILFGLGNDCSLLLYQAYLKAAGRGITRYQAITESIQTAFPSILCATITNAVGFSALALSGSAGFSQLGVLTAAGLGACALLMCVFFFVFVHAASPPASDPLQDFLSKWLTVTTRYPSRILYPTLGILFIIGAFALSSWRPLRFDTASNSLEPTQIPASRALRIVRSEFSSTPSPLLIVVPASLKTAAQTAQQLDHCLRSLGRKFSSPLPFISQPASESINLQMLNVADIQSTRSEFSAILQQYGFHPSAFTSTFVLLNFLETAAQTVSPPNWKQILPPNSPWWFLIDRFVSSDSSTFLALVWPQDQEHPEETIALVRHALQTAGIAAYVTGLQETLDELVPWAVDQLWKFGTGAGIVILLILAIAYRNFALWTLHALSLAFSLGGLIGTLKFFNLPINFLNILAFPLILGVSVDYGAFLILSFLRKGNFRENVVSVMKPILISALSSVIGFGCLLTAENPSLRGLGIVCSLGTLWALVTTFLMVLPGVTLLRQGSCHKGT